VNRARGTVSVHLRVLRTTGIVKQARRGRSRRYTLNAARLRPIESWLQRVQARAKSAE
jgi:DNA-binding transcriptional ArsR family regulator